MTQTAACLALDKQASVGCLTGPCFGQHYAHIALRQKVAVAAHARVSGADRGDVTRGLDDLEIDAAAALNQRLLRRLGSEVELDTRERWVRDSIPDLYATVRSFEPRAYALPSHFEKIMPAEEFATLSRILGEVRALNEECAGLRVGESVLLLGTDSRSGDIRRDLMAFFDRLIPLRLARPNPRDQGDPVRRFKRVGDELLPFLEQILNLAPSVHPNCLSKPVGYAAWLLYRATWRRLVTCTRRAGGFDIKIRCNPDLQSYCNERLSAHQWYRDDDLANVLSRARGHAPALDATGPDASRLRLKAMAEDLEAMRPLLVRNWRTSRSLITLAPGLCVAWQWTLGEVAGHVLVAPDERSLVAADHDLAQYEMLVVDREGLLAALDVPWLRSVDLDAPEAALAANLYIVERLYSRVFEMYSRVDTAAVLARFRAPTEAESSDDAGECADEAIAIAVQVHDDGEPVGEAAVSGGVARPRRRVMGMRFERFIRLLVAMGCEVRQGKGSEVNVYRDGGRIARIGHHLRNPELSPGLVRMVLDRLDIPVAEFLARIS